MSTHSESRKNPITEPPLFCEYAGGACDQSFAAPHISDGLILFPSEPEIIANTIEEALPKLKSAAKGRKWLSWKDLGIVGRIIFCEICKALRFTKVAVADVSLRSISTSSLKLATLSVSGSLSFLSETQVT
jgi:hypothetical protein